MLHQVAINGNITIQNKTAILQKLSAALQVINTGIDITAILLCGRKKLVLVAEGPSSGICKLIIALKSVEILKSQKIIGLSEVTNRAYAKPIDVRLLETDDYIDSVIASIKSTDMTSPISRAVESAVSPFRNGLSPIDETSMQAPRAIAGTR